MPVSTRNLASLPDGPTLRRLMQSLAMLDAIMSPEWQDRYYSFNSKWSLGEEMGSMRNGSGDHWFSLFTQHGVALHGLDHESVMFRPGSPWPGIFDSLPPQFESFRTEPAFDTTNSTFCIWRAASDAGWSCGVSSFPEGDDPDGSERLLSILDGVPRSYSEFASWYYEIELPLASVEAIYRHQPLTNGLLATLNPATTLATLGQDLIEIGYPLY